MTSLQFFLARIIIVEAKAEPYEPERFADKPMIVDVSRFSTRDELEYQSARLARENQLAENFSKQGMTEENYPIYGTNFWGSSPENN